MNPYQQPRMTFDRWIAEDVGVPELRSNHPSFRRRQPRPARVWRSPFAQFSLGGMRAACAEVPPCKPTNA